jgi:hypothetical protein
LPVVLPHHQHAAGIAAASQCAIDCTTVLEERF